MPLDSYLFNKAANPYRKQFEAPYHYTIPPAQMSTLVNSTGDNLQPKRNILELLFPVSNDINQNDINVSDASPFNLEEIKMQSKHIYQGKKRTTMAF
ncbi:hypothetical protein AVEN_150087-1 [Araneus ventricosus]|uniref:Uncharacterized protein n=1 Tax=Araneus ventricosus TaxID=182803 RepID=A0A4Y2DFQ8_ARAVE|nr:hypothetical protein AVEN_150087-1 [Araneus ventricosus]